MPQPRTNGSLSLCPRTVQSSTYVAGTNGFPTTFPTIGNYWGDCVGDITYNSILNSSKNSKGHITNSNPIMTASDNNGGSASPNMSALVASMQTLGYANNIRAEYQSKYI